MTVEIFHPKAPAIFSFITCLLSCFNLCNKALCLFSIKIFLFSNQNNGLNFITARKEGRNNDDNVVTSKILDVYHNNPVPSLEFAKRITKVIKSESCNS